MRVNVNGISPSVNIPLYTSIENILAATNGDTYLQELKVYIIWGMPHKKEDVCPSMRQYWPISKK